MSEILILRRGVRVLRVAVVRRPGLRLRALVRRLVGGGESPAALARRLKLRPAYVDRVCAEPEAPRVTSARAGWSALVREARAAVEREMAA